MPGCVAFTRALDGKVHCASGDFTDEPLLTSHNADRFEKLIRRKLDDSDGRVDQMFNHAARPGGVVAMILIPGCQPHVVLAAPRPNLGLPPQPAEWLWREFRDGYCKEPPGE